MLCVKEELEMAKRIITISREFGSGGRFIGEEVAKKLGIAYYLWENMQKEIMVAFWELCFW